MRELRQWILGSVIGSGFLLIVSVFFAGMWAVLFHLGDEVGAKAAQGATGVSAAGLVVTHVLLVTLLALAFLQKNMDTEGREGEPSSERPARP